MSLPTEYTRQRLISTAMGQQLSALLAHRSTQFGIALAFVLVVFYVRRHFEINEGYIWSEDAGVFMAGAYQNGARSIFTPYAGYLHLLPRLIAYSFSKISPITAAPYTFACASILIYAGCATYLFRVAMRRLGSSACAIGIACAPFLVAHSGEVYLSITNLQWIVAPVLLVLLWEIFTPGTSRNAWTYRLVAVFILINTGPFAVIFSPAVFFILWLNRATLSDRHGLSALTICVVAGSVQLIAMHFATPVVPDPNLSHDWSRFSWPREFLLNFAAEMYVPASRIGERGLLIGAVLTAFVAAVACTARARIMCLILLGFAVAMWAIGVWRTSTPDIPVHWYNYGARYLVIPHIFSAWAMLVACATLPRAAKCLPIALLALMAWTSLDRFEGTHWGTWNIQYLGDSTYKVKVPPGIEATVRDLR